MFLFQCCKDSVNIGFCHYLSRIFLFFKGKEMAFSSYFSLAQQALMRFMASTMFSSLVA